MASLRAFDSIQGTPAPKAITLRAVAQAAGHQIHIVRSSDAEAVVAGLRRGSDTWEESTWTIERADRMGLTSKAQWKQQPAAMLVARATSEVCRWIASDAIMGMPYSAEEISDTTGLQAQPATRRVTAADIIGKAVEHAQPTVDAIDRREAIARIRTAEDQDQLDQVKVLCQAAGIRDKELLDLWLQRSIEIANGDTPDGAA
jgi:hypothetical protein